MKTESRELYCYTTGTEPFKSRYENLSTKMISLTIATRGLVKDAIGQYGKDYGNGNGFEIFSEDDFKECVDKIIDDVKEREGVCIMDEYTRDFLSKYNRVFNPSEIEEFGVRKPINSMEAEGAVWMSAQWIAENLDDDIRDVYDNITPFREDSNGKGSFNIYEFYNLYDEEKILKIGGVVISGSCVFLEVWNMEMDKAVAYIGIN